MKYIFFLIVLAILVGMIGYVMLRGWQVLPSKTQIRVIYSVVYVTLFAVMLSGIFLEHVLSPGLSKTITFVGYTFFMAVIYMLMSFLIVDLIRISNSIIHFAPQGMITFRSVIAGISLGLTIIFMIIGNYKFNHPVITELDISIEEPSQNKVVNIVAASDIHLGSSIDKKRLRKYVDLINAQNPDIILLAGDITDRSISRVMEQNMKEELQALRAPLGVYAISGNHEFYSGKPHEIEGYLKASGINVLFDNVSLVDSSFYIVGRDDRTNRRRKPLSELVSGLDKKYPMILMDHQPYHLEDAQKNDIDLQISGHTHNGQFFPGNLIVANLFEKGYGYLKKGKTHYYISSGLGIWGPQYRIGTKSEIVKIRLRY